MKQLFLLLAMLLCVSSAFGQTADKLIKKYKALPNAEYAETTEQTRAGIPEKNNETNGLSAEDYDFIRKNFKKAEQLQLTLDDDQKAELAKDIEGLRGFELLYTQNDNSEPEESKNPVQNMINQTFNPDYQLRIYGKVKNDIVNHVLIRWDIWGKVALVHLDCKIKKEQLLKSFINDDVVSFNEKVTEETGMNDVMKEVKNGNALFVINGKECPEIHSMEEAKEYMEKHDFHFNHESWVVGSAVRAKYPNTDKKVVIEFSRIEK